MAELYEDQSNMLEIKSRVSIATKFGAFGGKHDRFGTLSVQSPKTRELLRALR